MRGDLEQRPDGLIEGWCWLPSRPSARLRVELLVDDEPVTTLVADRLREDLASSGVGDGRHGFLARAPDRILAETVGMLSARERSTGQVFAQRRLAAARVPAAVAARLDAMARELDRLRLMAAAPLPRSPAARVRGGFADCAVALARRSRTVEAGTRQGDPAVVLEDAVSVLSALGAPIMFPGGRGEAAPSASLIVLSGASFLDTLAALRGLVQAAAAVRADVVLVDDGRDPRTALIHVMARNLSSTRVASGGSAQRVAAGAALARGARLVFLDGDAVPSAAALLPLLTGHETVLGWAGASAAGSQGIAIARDERRGDEVDGLRLAIPRDVLLSVAGFDPRLDASLALQDADVALKAGLTGASVRSSGASSRGAAARPQPVDPAAMALFAARWRPG